jgi:hypothetical protein
VASARRLTTSSPQYTPRCFLAYGASWPRVHTSTKLLSLRCFLAWCAHGQRCTRGAPYTAVLLSLLRHGTARVEGANDTEADLKRNKKRFELHHHVHGTFHTAANEVRGALKEPLKSVFLPCTASLLALLLTLRNFLPSVPEATRAASQPAELPGLPRRILPYGASCPAVLLSLRRWGLFGGFSLLCACDAS